jgi:uncharacterized protein YccT (UPF0319 family)
MAKKSTPTTTTTEPNVEGIKAAVAAGKALIDEGKTKAEAAMAIYLLIEGEEQDTVVKAFVEGATLTEKGALTYWYNCRRKVKRMRLLGQIESKAPPVKEG